LLHPTCLPGNQGIGTFDHNVDRFLDFVQAAGMSHWQLCPLGPTGYGDSPYQCFSAFAGNPYLIDVNDLIERGFLTEAEVAPLRALPSDKVDFGALYQLKWPLLRKAFGRFKNAGSPPWEEEDFDVFKGRHAEWLEDYVFFRALKDHFGGSSWYDWPLEARDHASALKSGLQAELEGACEAHRFYQYVFFVQWARIRQATAARGISVIGDIPIFVAADSADAWSHPELFELDPVTRQPLAVAGVPPDYFSADGQLWGNPLYDWKAHAENNYEWWKARLLASSELYDVVRIDHFRGFESFWRVPFPATTAREGEWAPGPGLDLFHALKAEVADAKIIAEDLGLITPEVVALREESGCPGMAVLQFAFGGDEKNPYLPHNLIANEVTYTGTHDNDTTLGWYHSLDEPTKDQLRRYLRVDGREVGWDLIRAAYEAVSRLAVIPLQDILSLGTEARLNTPGKAEGNWQWRCRSDQIESLFGNTTDYLQKLAGLYGRLKGEPTVEPER